MKLIYKLLLLLFIVFITPSCSNRGDIPKIREYIYKPNAAIPNNSAIIISKVFDNRSEEERKQNANNNNNNFMARLVAPLEKLAEGLNAGFRKIIRGNDKLVFGAQIILLGHDQTKYYLGDYYGVRFFDSEHRRFKVGNKGDLEVYQGMAAYSILSIPCGEYKVVGSVYYQNPSLDTSYYDYGGILKTTDDRLYNARTYKKFSIYPGEVVYIGDIGVSNAGIEVINKFNEAQEYIDLSYPYLAKSLLFRPIQ